MLEVQWTVSGHSGLQKEDYRDSQYEKAYERYAELVEHLRCFDIALTFTHEYGNEVEEVILHEEMES